MFFLVRKLVHLVRSLSRYSLFLGGPIFAVLIFVSLFFLGVGCFIVFSLIVEQRTAVYLLLAVIAFALIQVAPALYWSYLVSVYLFRQVPGGRAMFNGSEVDAVENFLSRRNDNSG